MTTSIDPADYNETQIAQYNILVPLLDDSVSVYAGVHGSENLAAMIVEARAHAAAEPVDTTEFEEALSQFGYDKQSGNLGDESWQYVIDLFVRAATR